MASMATSLFLKPRFPSHPFPKTHKTHLSSNLKCPIPHLSNKENRKNKKKHLRVSSGLIEPDGGKLVELVVEEPLRDEKRREAMSIPRIKLSRIDLEWVHVISEGWASPLRGFMREAEFLQTLHFNSLRLGDGSVVNMSVPIVLAIDDSQKQRIGGSSKVALVGPDDNPVAILNK